MAEGRLVKAKLAAIVEVTPESEEKILDARKSSDALTDCARAEVDNLSVLEAAEKKLEELQPAELLDIYGTSMTVANSLEMKFFIDVLDLKDRTDLYATITKTCSDGRPDVTVTIPYVQWKDRSKDLKYISFNGISAKELCDDVFVQIFDTNGKSQQKIDR